MREFITMSKRGDKMECSVWSGPMLGIRVGFPNRNRHFRRDVPSIDVDINGELCTVDIPPSFWRSCPEFRVAKDKSGLNYLSRWIFKNKLMPPRAAKKVKGREDKLILEVMEPYRRFRLYIKK